MLMDGHHRRNDAMMLVSIRNSDAQRLDFSGSKSGFLVNAKSRLFFTRKADTVADVRNGHRVGAEGSDHLRCDPRKIAASTAGCCLCDYGI
jgi:hypothetical protein